MSKFRRFPLLAPILLMALLLSACAERSGAPVKAGAQGKTKVVLAVGGAECLCYLPVTLALELGYFAEQGLEIDMQDMKGGSKALQALQGGSADVVSGYYEHTIRMQTQEGKGITSFVNFARYPGLVLVVGKKAEGKIQSVKDLKGATVGVSSPGSATHAFANFLLSKEGLKPSDISVVGIGLGSTAVAALEQGSVDAAVLLDPAVTQLLNRDSIKILIDTRTDADTRNVFGSGYAAGSLYTTTDFLEKNPVVVQRMTNAIVKALRFIDTNTPAEIAAKMPEAYYAGDQALYIAALKAAHAGYSRDGLMPVGAPKNTLEILALSDEGVHAKKEDVKLERTYTDDFVKRASK